MENNSIIKEYIEIKGKNTEIAFMLDCYENFGWELDERFVESIEEPGKKIQMQERIVLKRNRKIINKAELTRLQRNFESCVAEINALRKSEHTLAQIVALSTGIIGTAFMAGSTFAATANPPSWILCVILAIPGFIGWILPLFLFRKINARKRAEIAPLIEAKYDEINNLCEKGNKLLYH